MPSATDPGWRFKIDGSSYTLPTASFKFLELNAYDQQGESELTFLYHGGVFPTRPDTFLAKSIQLEYTVNGTDYVTCFKGQCVDMSINYTPVGWGRNYTARGLSYMGDLVPITNTNTGDDKYTFNAEPDNPLEYRADLAGRTVGEMLANVLDDTTLASDLNDVGVTGYNSGDLDAITHIPPYPCRLAGMGALTAIKGFLQQHAPNHTTWVDPSDGTLRILDTRKYGSNADGYPDTTVLTMNDDTDLVEVQGIQLQVSINGCFSRVKVRGAEYAEMRLYQLTDDTLAEDFAWGAFDNEDAKDDWALGKWNGANGEMRSVGTCVCTDTTHVTLNPTDPDQEWDADEWDQTDDGRWGILAVTYTAGSGITWTATRKAIDNASLSAGGTSAFTLDRALPHDDFDTYELRGRGLGSALVWRDYAVTDPDMAERLRPLATFPAPIINSQGNAAVMSSTPIFEVEYTNGSGATFIATASGVLDYENGHVILDKPSVTYFGTQANLEAGGEDTDGIPSNVRAWIPTQTDALQVVCPEDSGSPPGAAYEGTLSTIEGIDRTLTVTAPYWRDPGNEVNMQAYACELLDSVKDTTIVGTIPLLRFNATFLTPGQAVQLAGDDFTTGWESYTLPVVGCRLRWNHGGAGTHYRMELQVSNKRQSFSADQYDRPITRGEWGGLGEVALGLVMPHVSFGVPGFGGAGELGP